MSTVRRLVRRCGRRARPGTGCAHRPGPRTARHRRVGQVAIRAPRVNDKRVDEESAERRRFSSKILPAYARRSPKVNDVLPVLYLRGLSTGDFRPALEQLLGEDAAGLSPTTITRLCKDWEA